MVENLLAFVLILAAFLPGPFVTVKPVADPPKVERPAPAVPTPPVPASQAETAPVTAAD
jgi:hypothetical protein